MLISTDQLSNSPYFNEEFKSKDLDKCYYVIQNIFEESVAKNIPGWCKNLIPYKQFCYTDQLYNNPKNKIYTSLKFDINNKIIDRESYLKKGIPSSSLELNEFICTLIERFAKELKLIGKHKIHVDFYRMQYFKDADMESFQLDWHFDTFAKSTLTAVFQNDFPYKEGNSAGLDIAENENPGPHSPYDSRGFEPKNNYISCPYIQNGAIIFFGKQGQIIHRRSILNEPSLLNATRTTIQIKLKDTDWSKI